MSNLKTGAGKRYSGRGNSKYRDSRLGLECGIFSAKKKKKTANLVGMQGSGRV